MINDGSVYENNFTLLQQIISLKRRVENLEAQSGGGGSYVLPTASATVKGGVKIGSGLSMNGETLNATGGGSYELPVASETTLGGIKVGEGLGINNAGYLFVQGGGGGGYTLPVATDEVLGGVKIGDNLGIDANGVLSGKGVVIDEHLLPSNRVGFWEYSEGFLFGTCTGIALDNAKDYITPLTFVNDDNSSDTITLYIGAPYSGNSRRNFSLPNPRWEMLFPHNWGEDTLTIANAMGQGSYSGEVYDLALYNSPSQTGNNGRVWGIASQSSANFNVFTDGNGRFKVTGASGAITQIRANVEDGGSWKQYTWTGSISIGDLININEYAYLTGTWYCIR